MLEFKRIAVTILEDIYNAILKIKKIRGEDTL
jgi:hypothetical protein